MLYYIMYTAYIYIFIHSAPAATACSAHMLQSLQHVQGHQLQGLSQAWLLIVAEVRISFRKTCLYDMNWDAHNHIIHKQITYTEYVCFTEYVHVHVYVCRVI